MPYADAREGALRGGRQSTAVSDVAALTGAASVAAPTKAEFDAVVADCATLRTKVNALLTALRNAGFVAAS
jgi:hypothetical protein